MPCRKCNFRDLVDPARDPRDGCGFRMLISRRRVKHANEQRNGWRAVEICITHNCHNFYCNCCGFILISLPHFNRANSHRPPTPGHGIYSAQTRTHSITGAAGAGGRVMPTCHDAGELGNTSRCSLDTVTRCCGSMKYLCRREADIPCVDLGESGWELRTRYRSLQEHVKPAAFWFDRGPFRCNRCKAYVNPFFLWHNSGKEVLVGIAASMPPAHRWLQVRSCCCRAQSLAGNMQLLRAASGGAFCLAKARRDLRVPAG